MRQNTNDAKRMTVGEFFEAIKNLEDTIYEIKITTKFKKSLNRKFINILFKNNEPITL